jgi:zinc transport system ATP-binding protein
MEPLLDIRNLSVAYGNEVVLENVNLTVSKNDFIGIIGPNGGGKTTFLKSILGLITPVKGEIIFGPELVNGHGYKLIGYLPQVTHIDRKFPITVTDVVLSGLMSKRKMFKRFTPDDITNVKELLFEMGLFKIRKKAIGELSGGQIQRTMLCRALINKPKLLVLDEPGTFVDSKFENELYERLGELNNNMAILLVSHDVGTITSMVKSIACINRSVHYHPTNTITQEQLEAYDCPIQLITHGKVPHTVLGEH